MIDKPLYGNPLAGGIGPQEIPKDQLANTVFDPTPVPKGGAPMFMGKGTLEAFDMGKYEGNPYANPNFIDKTIIGNDIYGLNPGGPTLIDPNAEAQKKAEEEFLKTADEYQKGFRQSEFYKPNAPMTADVAEFLYKSPTGEDITMKGSSSQIGQFGKYLDSIGKGDLLQSMAEINKQDFSNILENTGGQSLFPIKNEKGEDIGGIENTAIASPVQPEFNNTGIFNSPYETTGQYLTGPNESGNVLEILKNIEQGIASLGGNFGQNFNMNQSSNYGDFSNFGIGSFFPPYGGMYG